MVSLFSTIKPVLLAVDQPPDQGEALVDIERGLHSAQCQPKLDQRDRHGRLHADHHRDGIEHPRHGGDVVEHAADEGVHHFQGRDVDHHAARATGDDLGCEVVLQRHGQAVVHVDLNADEQTVADLEDRNLFHAAYSAGVWADLARSTTVLPTRRRARANASAIVALEVTDKSTPRCTIVCAICGRMPLMMQSAPISRAAETVFSRCCATSVSTVGTPVMSMIAICEPEATICCSRLSITICVRLLSSVPISGTATMPSQSCTTGVESSNISCCWREMTSSRLFWK